METRFGLRSCENGYAGLLLGNLIKITILGEPHYLLYLPLCTGARNNSIVRRSYSESAIEGLGRIKLSRAQNEKKKILITNSVDVNLLLAKKSKAETA